MISTRQAVFHTTKVAAGAIPRPLGGRVHVPSSYRTLVMKPVCSTKDRPGSGNSSVVDKTSIDWDTASKFLKKRPPTYKVMLHNDSFNRREHVVQVLMKVISGMTTEHAMNVMQEAHENGMAMVIACPQDEAEDYCEQLRTNGLKSSIEF